MGGVHVANFTIGGVLADLSLLPGFPSEFSPYFGPGEGGAYVTLGTGDPECAARWTRLQRRGRSTGAPALRRRRGRFAAASPRGEPRHIR